MLFINSKLLDCSRICALAALLAGCTDKGETSEASTGSTSDPGTTSDAPTTTGDTSTGEPSDEMFGFTCVSIGLGENVDADPFIGTRKVQVTLDYDPCLADYYVSKHPEQRLDGPDGADVFADWKQRLCGPDLPGHVDCEVDSFAQVLSVDGKEQYKLTITYNIPEGANLNGGKLLWGPGPLAAFAECAEGDNPTVRLAGIADVVGLDDSAKVIWNLQSYGNNTAQFGLTGAGCIEVNVQPAF